MPTLDTRFFVELFGQKDQIKLKRLKDLAKKPATISVISLHELYKLFTENEGRIIAEHRLRLIQASYDTIDITTEIAINAAQLRVHIKIPTANSLIGATALKNDRIVISDDPHYQQIKGLQVKWI